MKIEATLLPGVFRLEPVPHPDERGFFARIHCPDELAAAGISFTSTQVNLSRNTRRHTLRGMHYQDAPFAEAKIVRVARGAIHDVVVDLRPESPTFRQHIGADLDAAKGMALFIPEGCAHGFLTLEDETDVLYQMGRPYVPGQARGCRWDDPALGIVWPHPPAVIGAADLAWPLIT